MLVDAGYLMYIHSSNLKGANTFRHLMWLGC